MTQRYDKAFKLLAGDDPRAMLALLAGLPLDAQVHVRELDREVVPHNRLVDHWRRECRRAGENSHDGAGTEQPDVQPGPQRLADLRDCLEQLLKLVTGLPDVQRQVFLLRHEAGMSVSQIAEAMNTGMETTKSRLRYAMERLRSAIARECLEAQ